MLWCIGYVGNIGYGIRNDIRCDVSEIRNA